MKISSFLILFPLFIKCAHPRSNSEKIKTQRIFNLEKQAALWPQDFYVEGVFKDGIPKIEHRVEPPKIEGDLLRGSCNTWVLKEEGKWIEIKPES